MRALAAAGVMLAVTILSSVAEARPSHWAHPVDDWRRFDGRYDWTEPMFFKRKVYAGKRKAVKAVRKAVPRKRVAVGIVSGAAGAASRSGEVAKPVSIPLADAPTIAGYQRNIAKSSKVADLVPGLASKVSAIISDCGSKLISGFRRGALIAGTGRPSLHARWPSQAADLQGNPSCIYKHLAGWAGGYSTDYARVKHVHVSLASDRRERGSRFVHGGGGRRYAKHRSHRYAYHRQYRWASARSY